MNHRFYPFIHLIGLAYLACWLTGCDTSPSESDTLSPHDILSDIVEDSFVPPDSFDGHTVSGFDSEEALLTYGSPGPPQQIKFVIPRFTEPEERTLSFMEYPFYTLHDQWYWFRLLNNIAIDGYHVEPVSGYSFKTVDEITTFFEGETILPLDLKFAGDRLYSPEFYAEAFGEDRFFGLGSVLHFEPHPDRVLPEELWLFELEYNDALSEAELTVFFEMLEAQLPDHVANELRWLTRSPEQEELGNLLRDGDGPYATRVVNYSDLVVEGAFETYNPGITAGRVSIFEGGTLSQADLTTRDIVVLEDVPDYLPPVAGIITGVPQTPLSHLNLLAKSRGTPNIYIGGATDNMQLHDYAYFKKYVVMEFSDEGFLWNPISVAEYNQYKDLKTDPVLTVETIDLSTAPYLLDLTTGTLEDVDATIPLTGGKSAQMMAFNGASEIQTPDLPAAITIRGFAEHVAPLENNLKTLFADPTFEGDVSVRFLCLEGADAYIASQPDPLAAQTWISSILNSISTTSPVFTTIAEGGVREKIRSQTLNTQFEEVLLEFLHTRYASFHPSQGLRFRSSSTAEDIEGFNGAGLYESHTGYLFPEAQSNKNQYKTVTWALLEAWSSYYAFEAFEERRAAGIDHFSANMGLLVHARFDNEHELSNGVFTLELKYANEKILSTLTVNAQDRAISVTNPEPGSNALPEIDSVTQDGDDNIEIQRLQASNMIPSGEWILSDERLLEIHGKARAMAIGWLDNKNEELEPTKKESSLILDFEYRHMSEGWPALADGPLSPGGFIWKQVRTLSPPISLPPSVHAYPIPADILAYTSAIDAIYCEGSLFEATWMSVYTDPEIPGPFDYALAPFLAKLTFKLTGAIEGVALNTDDELTWYHTDFAQVTSVFDAEAGWETTIVLKEEPASSTGVSSLSVSESGEWTLVSQTGEVTADEDAPCEFIPIVTTPTEYLKSLLETGEDNGR